MQRVGMAAIRHVLFQAAQMVCSLKTLPTLQSMAQRQLADIFPTNKALLNTPFGDEPSPLHFRFQAAYCAYIYIKAA